MSTLQIRKGPAATVPVLAEGELGFTTDTNKLLVGTGYGNIVVQNEVSIPAGSVTSFAGASIPSGWLLCNGQAVSRTGYADLFTAIGTLYGSGDGSTTFNCPDFRGAFLRGTGSHGSQLMANGSAFAGGSLGSYGLDKMQGHWFQDMYVEGQKLYWHGANPGSGTGTLTTSSSAGNILTFRNMVTNGTNGNPRTGSETNPFHSNLNFIIKV